MLIDVDGMMAAAKIRPGHIISFNGLESDKVKVEDITPRNGYTSIEIKWEDGQRVVPIDYLVNVYEEA